jgi:predicted N-formylglutamate amidohydrolase
MREQRAFESVNASGSAPILLVCDHATNIVPQAVGGGSLGLPEAEMARHIAYDLGARGVTLALAELLDAPVSESRYSRR